MLIKLTAEGNNASGKTTVLSLIYAMLKEKGFTDVQVVGVEETPEVFQAKGEQVLKFPGLTDAKIELHEKWGTIER